MKECKVDVCDRTDIEARGYCHAHYQWALARDFNKEPTHKVGDLRSPQESECVVDGCKRETHAKSLCNKHYSRNGDPHKTRVGYDVEVDVCQVEWCDDGHYTKRLCQSHYRRMYEFGVSVEWINERPYCGVCGDSFEEDGVILHVDHNHETGDVRGALCSRCNMAIGLLREREDVLRCAIKYLGEHNE